MDEPRCFFSGDVARCCSLEAFDGYSFSSPHNAPDFLYEEYWITREAMAAYSEGIHLTPLQKMNCLAETIRLNRQGLVPFWVVSKSMESTPDNPSFVMRQIDDIKDQPLQHRNKELDIVLAIADKLASEVNPFAFIKFSRSDRYALKIFSDDEFADWAKSLYRKGLIDLDTNARAYFKNISQSSVEQSFVQYLPANKCIGLTSKGWDLVQTSRIPGKSNIVFVAMAFTDNAGSVLPNTLRETIKDRLRKMGWEPVIVDEVEHNDGIMDKVIASIREASFVVAELSHQKSGVYYEAGFAKALALPVIHAVSESDFKNCHFDVKHLKLIVWKDFEDLAQKLENRILATIGKPRHLSV